MRHYKLTSDFLANAVQNSKGFTGNAKGYNDAIGFVTRNGGCEIRRDTAVEFHSVAELLQDGFVFASER